MKILLKRKSQMKIQEMSFMIIGLAVFFIIVLLFYLSLSLSGIKKTAGEGARYSAIALISALAGSPEFSCADSSALCIDADKLIILSTMDEYSGFWNVAGLRVEKIYPANNKIKCTIQNYPACDVFEIISAKKGNIIEDTSYASICRQENLGGYHQRVCELGRIVVTSEKKS